MVGVFAPWLLAKDTNWSFFFPGKLLNIDQGSNGIFRTIHSQSVTKSFTLVQNISSVHQLLFKPMSIIHIQAIIIFSVDCQSSYFILNTFVMQKQE